MQQWGHGVSRPVHDQQLRAGFLRALGWAGMRTLTLTLAGASPHLPSTPPYLAQTGIVCLEGIQLGQDCVGQLGRVLWSPGGGMGRYGARGSGVGEGQHRLGVKVGARDRSQVTG